ncbi:MAG: phage portal protein [candidate division WOR-3 bacterium]
MLNIFGKKRQKKGMGWLKVFSFRLSQRDRDNPSELLEGYDGFIFACVNIIASRVAGARIRLFLREGNSEKEVSSHPLLELIGEPNPYITQYSFLYLTQGWMELTGNAYWVRVGNELWPLPPQWVRVVPGQWPRVIEGYLYMPPWLPEPMAFSDDEVIHFKRPNPQDPFYYGASTLRAAFGETEFWRLAGEYRNNRLENGGVPPAAMVISEEANPDDIDRIRAEFQRLHRGMANAGRPAILPPGTEVRLLEVPPVDREFAESIRLTRENILAIFGVPGSKLGLVQDVNRANAEANDLTFLNEVIRPRLRFLEDILNSEITYLYGDSLVLRFEDPVPRDWEFTLRKVETLVTLGVMEIDEARREMELE